MAGLASLTIPGLYAIVNENSKTVYVGLSNNILKAFAMHIEDIKKNRHDYIKLHDIDVCEFKVLEEISDVRIRKLRYSIYTQEYIKKGYTLYRDYFPLKYKLRVTVECIDNRYMVVVSLVNSRNEKTVVGMFKDNKYAEKFIEKHYPKGEPITKVVYTKT